MQVYFFWETLRKMGGVRSRINCRYIALLDFGCIFFCFNLIIPHFTSMVVIWCIVHYLRNFPRFIGQNDSLQKRKWKSHRKMELIRKWKKLTNELRYYFFRQWKNMETRISYFPSNVICDIYAQWFCFGQPMWNTHARITFFPFELFSRHKIPDFRIFQWCYIYLSIRPIFSENTYSRIVQNSLGKKQKSRNCQAEVTKLFAPMF